MPRISVTDLWQGMSTQPPWKRHPGQVENAQNFHLDVRSGARKRSPTRLVKNVSTSIVDPDGDFYIETIRGATIFIGDGEIIGFDEDGNQLTVSGDLSYLDGVTPDDIDTTVAIDTMVICNRNTVMQTERTDDYTVKGEVDFFSDLDDLDPPPDDGDVYKVLTSENFDPVGYYQYDEDEDEWNRIAAPNQPSGSVRTSTWPHRLVYDEDAGTLTFSEIPSNDRLSGNQITNPRFPIVSETCQSVQFYDGRLAYIGTDTINLTAAGDIFTVYVNDVNNMVDDDPISRQITIKNVGTPKRTEQVGDALVIVCENGILEYSAGSDRPLSPATNLGRIRQLADFKARDVRPGVAGGRIVLADQFNDLHVFQWSNSTLTVEYSGSTTSHVSGLLDGVTIDGIYLNNLTTYVTTDTDTMYVHDLFFQEGQLAQSAWSKYDFSGETTALVSAWGNEIRLWQKRSGRQWSLVNYQHRETAAPTGFDFDPRLDRRELVSGTYDFKTNRTRFAISGREAGDFAVRVVTTKTPSGETSHEYLTPIASSGSNIWVQGNWSGYDHYIGTPIDAELEFSKFYAGASTVRPMLAGFNVFHHESTNYTIQAGRKGTTLREIEWQSFYLNAKSLGETMVETGHSRNLLLGNGQETTIKIVNDGPGTCTISDIELLPAMKGRS